MLIYDTQASLKQLIDNKITEDQSLEYKQDIFQNSKIENRVKYKMLREITAFANTSGGTIIVGIKEDDEHNPTELVGAGLTSSQFEEWHASFNQIVQANVLPRLYGLTCTPVPLDNNQIAIVISVPKSYSRPHCCRIEGRQEYHMRVGNIMCPMEIEDLRKAFLYTNGLQDKIRQFHNERISMILGNECIGDMGTGPKIVFHIIPEWSFELGNTVDLESFRSNHSFQPFSGSSWDHRYNIDGWCIFNQDHTNGRINTYTQVFHNGIIEAAEIRCLSNYKPNQIYDWNNLQGMFRKKLSDYGQLMESLNIQKPWHIFATLLNGKGYCTTNSWDGNSELLDRDVIQSLDGICTDENSMDDALKPVFDSLCHAFGYARSFLYD